MNCKCDEHPEVYSNWNRVFCVQCHGFVAKIVGDGFYGVN